MSRDKGQIGDIVPTCPQQGTGDKLGTNWGHCPRQGTGDIRPPIYRGPFVPFPARESHHIWGHADTATRKRLNRRPPRLAPDPRRQQWHPHHRARLRAAQPQARRLTMPHPHALPPICHDSDPCRTGRPGRELRPANRTETGKANRKKWATVTDPQFSLLLPAS